VTHQHASRSAEQENDTGLHSPKHSCADAVPTHPAVPIHAAKQMLTALHSRQVATSQHAVHLWRSWPLSTARHGASAFNRVVRQGSCKHHSAPRSAQCILHIAKTTKPQTPASWHIKPKETPVDKHTTGCTAYAQRAQHAHREVQRP
jgi:hypothetical protein